MQKDFAENGSDGKAEKYFEPKIFTSGKKKQYRNSMGFQILREIKFSKVAKIHV